jgi:hypothetical protein
MLWLGPNCSKFQSWLASLLVDGRLAHSMVLVFCSSFRLFNLYVPLTAATMLAHHGPCYNLIFLSQHDVGCLILIVIHALLLYRCLNPQTVNLLEREGRIRITENNGQQIWVLSGVVYTVFSYRTSSTVLKAVSKSHLPVTQ